MTKFEFFDIISAIMIYLERNPRLLSEIKENLQVKKGTMQGETSNTRFSSAGSYQSKELGLEVYVGLKEIKYKKYKSFIVTQRRFVFELAVMSVVAQNMPHLLPELPLFYGLLVDKNGEPLAIVTEDFSENGKNEVKADDGVWSKNDLGLKALFVKDTISDEHFHPAFKVSPVRHDGVNKDIRKLGDFYPLLKTNYNINAHRKLFPEEQIERDLNKYTIKITHEL